MMTSEVKYLLYKGVKEMKRSKFREKYWTEKKEQENKIKEEIELNEILNEEKPRRRKKEND